MTDITYIPGPGYYDWLEFNTPLSSARADAIALGLATRRPRTVLDLGCGWGELLLRTVAAADGATGRGVDSDGQGLDRPGHPGDVRRGRLHRVEGPS